LNSRRKPQLKAKKKPKKEVSAQEKAGAPKAAPQAKGKVPAKLKGALPLEASKELGSNTGGTAKEPPKKGGGAPKGKPELTTGKVKGKKVSKAKGAGSPVKIRKEVSVDAKTLVLPDAPLETKVKAQGKRRLGSLKDSASAVPQKPQKELRGKSKRRIAKKA
jgi:hypothetical protein